MACIAARSRPLLLHGTLTTFRRRCGKPNCRCATGERHESPALVYAEGGVTHTMTLRADEVAEVAAAVARYDAAKADLDASAAAGLARLRARRQGRGGVR